MYTGVRPRCTTWIQRAGLPLALVAGALVPAGASAAVTRSSVLTPADPAFRLSEPEVKAAQRLTVSGTSDGKAGDLVDLVCTWGTTRREIKTAVPVGKDGGFSTDVELGTIKPAACVLRALPDKFAGKELDAFGGPLVAVTAFSPRAVTTPVRDAEGAAVLDYALESGHRRGYLALSSAGGGAVDQTGVDPQTLALQRIETWDGAGAVSALTVDGRTAYVGAGVPRSLVDGRPTAPKGFDGVRAVAALDERTGVLTVQETERALRCAGKDCAEVLDTGVALQRTLTFTAEHAIAGVQDRWVSGDERGHRVRVDYAERSGDGDGARWRFPGEPGFTRYAAGQRVAVHGPGAVLTAGPATAGPVGTLAYDPAPAAFAFTAPGELSDVVELAVPGGGAAAVRRTFALGDVTVQDDRDVDPPVVTIEGPTLTEAATVTVSGRALDNVGVARLTVDGQDVAVGPDGSYSTPIGLVVGENRITATATDAAGNRDAVAMVIRRTGPRPEPAATCTVPRVRSGSTVKAARAKLKRAGCRVSRKTKAVRSSKVRKGRVVGLSEKAGTRIDKRTGIVRIKVSKGARRR